MAQAGKIYFASDFHLGIPDHAASLEREKRIVRWLESIRADAEAIYLLGDLFDFWFEYRDVVPAGYVRLLGKLAELKDAGIRIEVFTGNHDLWMFRYFEKELQIPVHHHPLTVEHYGKKFFLAHGDGIGPGDRGYKFMKKIFTNRICQMFFSWLHPWIAFRIATFFSDTSRTYSREEKFLGEDREWQVLFAKDMLQRTHFDYFIFGHRHIAIMLPLENNATYINLGDWLIHNSYVVFDGEKASLLYFSA